MKNSSPESTTSQAVETRGVMQSVTGRMLESIRVAHVVMAGLADADGITSACGAGSRMLCPGNVVDRAGSLSGRAVRSARDRCEVGVDLLDISRSLEPTERLPMAP